MSVANQKKILVLLGSPRKKGNSTLLANRIIKGAEDAGALVETVYLHGLNIAPCRACEGCRQKDAKDCVVDDDMRPLYDKIRGVDALVYASPIYWFTVSAQLKLFMDRCYAFGAKDYRELAGKKAAVAMSFGDSDAFNSGCVNALRTFQDAFGYVGMKLEGMVYGSASDRGEIEANTDLVDRATYLGRKLAE